MLTSMLLTATGEEDYYEYLTNAQTLIGVTGNISTPSPYTTPENNFTFGLHRFIVGLNYGVSPSWELGINMNLGHSDFSSFEPHLEENQSVLLHAKYCVTRNYSEKRIFDFALGIYSDILYLVLENRLSSLSKTVVQLGTDYAYSDSKLCYFITFLQPTKFSFFMCEYKSRTSETNFGWRVLLSPDVKLDVFIRSSGNLKDWFSTFIFGLTLATE